jgi:hypothetical protein
MGKKKDIIREIYRTREYKKLIAAILNDQPFPETAKATLEKALNEINFNTYEESFIQCYSKMFTKKELQDILQIQKKYGKYFSREMQIYDGFTSAIVSETYRNTMIQMNLDNIDFQDQEIAPIIGQA